MATHQANGILDTNFLPADQDQLQVIQPLTSGRPGLVFIDGCPGVGKSFVLRVALHLWRTSKTHLVVRASTTMVWPEQRAA